MVIQRSSTQPSVSAWRNAVVVLFGLGGITISTWGPRLPSIRAELHITDGTIGLALAFSTIGAIAGLLVASPVLSWLGARSGIRLTVSIIAVGIILAAVGAGILTSLAVMIVGFIVVGIGLGATDVMLNVEGSAIERETARTLMPIMHGGWSVGAIIGSGIGAGASALGIAFQWQFIGEAIAIVVIAFVAVRFLPRAELPEAEAPREPVAQRVRQWLSGWTDWRLLVIGLVMLGVEVGEGGANSWLTLSVKDDHHQTDAVAALFFTAFAVGESAARIFGSPLVDRIGRVAAVRITTAIGIVGLILFIFGGPAWVVLVGTLFWSVGVSMGFPLGMSAAADSGPNPAARVSVVASIGYLAGLGGPPLIGVLADRFGLLGALWLIVVLLAVGFAAAGILRKRPSTSSPSTSSGNEGGSPSTSSGTGGSSGNGSAH